jgi:hypothetical protein
MSGTLNNKNAEKWTERTVLKYLSQILIDVKENEIPFLGRAMMNQGLSRKTWSYWKEKFAGNGNISERIELLESIFETHLFEGALKSKLAATVSIFALKNNHNWSEKRPPITIIKPEAEKNVTTILMPDGTMVDL